MSLVQFPPSRAAIAMVGLLVAALAGCRCDGSGRDGDGGGTTDSGGAGKSCAAATDCDPGLTCDPATMQCTADVPCTTHGDCGAAAFCDTDTCRVNTTGGPCDDDVNCALNETCMMGVCGCGGKFFTAMSVPPNMLIVLDRSGSMDDPVAGTGMTKWEIAVAAIEDLTMTYATQIRFGLAMYQGDGGDCSPGEVFVDVGDTTTTGPLISAAMAGTGPNGFTPIGDTLAAMVGYAGLADTTRPNYILLITDGMETCDGDGVAGATALAGQAPPVLTFVVGFGDGVDPDALDAIAVAGGTPIAGGPPFYYQADDPIMLSTAFGTIAGSVLSCTYTLSGVPPGTADLYVYFDGVEIMRDTTHADGWDYDPATNQITFYGPACAALQAGMVTDLQIVHGCPIG